MKLLWLQAKPKRERLGPRLTRAAMGAAALALLVAALIFNTYHYASRRAEMAEAALVQARITADALSAALMFGDVNTATEVLGFLKASPDFSAAVARGVDNAVFASYLHKPADHVSWSNGRGEGMVQWDDDHLHVRAPIVHDTRLLGHVEVVLGVQSLRRESGVFALTSLGAALVALAMAYALARGVRRAIDRTEEQLHELAYVDPVTGLHNRRAAKEQLQACIQRHARSGEGFGVMLLDLDDFSTINDSLGHAAGDEVLRTLARRLSETLKAGNQAFRFGGDEFIVVFDTDGTHEAARQAGAAAQLALSASIQVGGFEIQVRGSAGIAEFPHHARTESELLGAADAAMYSAKHAGKNAVAMYDEQMTDASRQRLRTESELSRALGNGEFGLVYQPIIDMASRTMVGVEALLRWHHPQRGTVSPAAFIPIAESSGLIVELGRHVLELATRQIASWEAEGFGDFYVAVNASARQLRDGLLLEQVSSALQSSGADPSRLEIEITEHSLVDDHDVAVRTLVSLRGLGVRVAIDDFGTGLSSLAYLRRLPIDKLKIDRGFVRELPGNESDAAIVTAIASMAHALGLRVVAEGIETAAQREYLAGLRVDFGQGYLFGRPMPAVDLRKLLRHVGPLPTAPATLDA
ncbi:MAG: EAL domain-containing protein [Burkholderiaceae bacterium]|nr:EAL domain-containing protein [Burkholderiaceae bacterium]